LAAVGRQRKSQMIQVMTKNRQNIQFNIVLIMLSLVIITGCDDNTGPLEPKNTAMQVVSYATTPPINSITPSVQVATPLAVVATLTPSPPTPTSNHATIVPLTPTSTLAPTAGPRSFSPSFAQSPNLDELIPIECMEGQTKDFVISTNEPSQTYFVEARRVILPLRICRNSYDDRSDFNWLFSIQVNSVISTEGRALDKWPNMYLHYRQHPDDERHDIRGNEGAIYSFRYRDRTNEHYVLGAGDRGIYDLVFEFEDTDGFDSIPRTIDFSIAIQIWYI
jgi:hypothetical protein